MDSTPGDTQSIQPTAGIPGFGRKERWAVLQYHIWRVSTLAEIKAAADTLSKEQLLAFLAARLGRTQTVLARNIRLRTAAEIAMDQMRVFYGIRVGAMESREFRTRPVPHWLFCFSETIEGLIQRMYFVVLLPDGMVVEPKFAQRLQLRLPKSDIGPTMNLTAEQLQIASMIDAKMQKLVCDGNDRLTMLGEMFDYMPDFKRLMDISEPDTMDELCRRFAGFFHYAKILEMVAAGIRSGAIKVPK